MRTEYRVDNGNWTTYSAPFALPNGRHVVSYRSVDNVNNTEAEGQTWLVIGAEKLIVELEANIKPLLALVFAVVLAAVGLWSSKRRPWKGKAGSVAVLRAFALISLPFFAAEALTGIASLMTGELKVPPAIGVGSVTDVVILLLGLAVAGYWATRIPPAPPKEVIDSQG